MSELELPFCLKMQLVWKTKRHKSCAIFFNWKCTLHTLAFSFSILYTKESDVLERGLSSFSKLFFSKFSILKETCIWKFVSNEIFQTEKILNPRKIVCLFLFLFLFLFFCCFFFVFFFFVVVVVVFEIVHLSLDGFSGFWREFWILTRWQQEKVTLVSVWFQLVQVENLGLGYVGFELRCKLRLVLKLAVVIFSFCYNEELENVRKYQYLRLSNSSFLTEKINLENTQAQKGDAAKRWCIPQMSSWNMPSGQSGKVDL